MFSAAGDGLHLGAHLVFSVMRLAAAVLQFGFVLVSVDHLTQITEVTDDRTNKLCSCRKNRHNEVSVNAPLLLLVQVFIFSFR